MKKIILSLIAVMASLSISAQSNLIKVYKNGSIVASYANTSSDKYSVELSQGTYIPIPSEDDYVDLGLPSGTLWAKCNIGADTETDYGLYFAWGETTGYSATSGHEFKWEKYKYCKGSQTTLTKYCTASSYGTVDNKTELEVDDDAATVNWGRGWCMPTLAQVQELIDNTDYSWATYNDVNGAQFTNKKDQSKYIFLPAAGSRYDNDSGDENKICNYWFRSIELDDSPSPHNAGFIYLTSSERGWDYGLRCYGQSVRAVRVSE